MNRLLSRINARPSQVEDSVPLRVVTTAMALTGVFTALQLTESPLWLAMLSIVGCIVGSYVSHRRRNLNNFVVKLWITVGILGVVYLFFNELLMLANANISDARIPLTKLLLALIALHCFDLPRRRDLSVSALVGVTLMTVASTLSRDLMFSWFIGVFMALSVCMFQLDCISRSLSKAKLRSSSAAPAPAMKVEWSRPGFFRFAACFAAVLISTLACFTLMPRTHINLQQLSFSSSLPYQMNLTLPSFLSDGSLKSSPTAYAGFSEELDTNYRGGLGDQVVLRVSTNYGTYLRGMSFDKFDGKIWRMTNPKQVTDQVARAGNCFDMSGRFPPPHVKWKDITQEIFVEEDSSNLVVATSVPYQIYFPSTKLEVDNYGGIRSPAGVKKDMVYTVFSHIPLFDYPAMRKMPQASETDNEVMKGKFANFLQVPRLSPEVSQIAVSIAGEGNNYVQAERLCKYLQAHFKYDLNAETSPLKTDSVSDFLLHTKRGSCEHFASALVMMCRTRGIPAMLVTGYSPGEYNPFTGLWDVHLNEAHSWVEVYVRRYGWIPLDPTPDSLMGRQPYQDPQSVLSYVAEALEPFWKQLKESTFVLAGLKAFQSGFLSLASGWVQVSSVFPQFLLIAVGAALLFSVAAICWQLKFFKGLPGLFGKKSRGLNDPSISLSEATAEFMAVSRALNTFGVERKQSETSSELLRKVADSMAESRMESGIYLENLAGFLDLYCMIRFGFATNSDLDRLKEMRQALDKMTLDLSKHRNLVGNS